MTPQTQTVKRKVNRTFIYSSTSNRPRRGCVGRSSFITGRGGRIIQTHSSTTPIISAGDKAGISTTDGAPSRGAEQSSEKVSCDFRPLLRKQDRDGVSSARNK
ncbi:hypothetical protein CEXT_725781 [Caerostris extrusa]|uniref:Uncharacterized protein n=1 Tax=Caerostris extrusa TaxID=172846 RepID=A0AAV4XV95_CAEEX|nr:hypothetical protein CEXT_725781 [Caerostris extrusa]